MARGWAITDACAIDISSATMTPTTPAPVPDFDPRSMAKFYDATALFFKRKLGTVEVLGRGGTPCLAVTESPEADRAARVESNTR
jgi:hypothetical protein